MELDEEHVVKEMRSVLVEEEEEKGLKEEEMARVKGTCIGHTEPGRRVPGVHPGPTAPVGQPHSKRQKGKGSEKNRHKSTKSKQDYPDFFVFALCGSAGMQSLAYD